MPTTLDVGSQEEPTKLFLFVPYRIGFLKSGFISAFGTFYIPHRYAISWIEKRFHPHRRRHTQIDIRKGISVHISPSYYCFRAVLSVSCHPFFAAILFTRLVNFSCIRAVTSLPINRETFGRMSGAKLIRNDDVVNNSVINQPFVFLRLGGNFPRTKFLP